MTDEEAAIVALGPSLIWTPQTPGFEPPPGFVWETARYDTEDGHRNYAVSVNPPHFGDQALAEVTYWNKNRRADHKRNAAEVPKRRHYSDACRGESRL